MCLIVVALSIPRAPIPSRVRLVMHPSFVVLTQLTPPEHRLSGSPGPRRLGRSTTSRFANAGNSRVATGVNVLAIPSAGRHQCPNARITRALPPIQYVKNMPSLLVESAARTPPATYGVHPVDFGALLDSVARMPSLARHLHFRGRHAQLVAQRPSFIVLIQPWRCAGSLPFRYAAPMRDHVELCRDSGVSLAFPEGRTSTLSRRPWRSQWVVPCRTVTPRSCAVRALVRYCRSRGSRPP
ncbi:hypothetical protein FKP32DRAFT_750036 [Trametes sanguinea]|nr:hypothetical protein FKP32DRAFT_750036 [Trametes sanguinea]